MTLRKVNLKVITEYNYYNQVSQTSDIKWSFLNRLPEKDSFRELHLNVSCREFLGDVVVSSNLKINLPEIHGLNLKDERIPLKETLLSVSMDHLEIKRFLKHFPLLRHIEKVMGIKMTKVYPTQDRTKLVIVGDKKWVSSPLLISIYSQIIRTFTYSTTTTSFEDHIKELITGSYGNDVNMFKTFENRGFNLIHLLLNIDRVLGNNPLTGVNDLQLKKSKKTIITKYSPVQLENKDNNKLSTYWSISANHSGHGVLSFCDKIYYRSCGESTIYGNKSIGVEWFINYIALKREQGI